MIAVHINSSVGHCCRAYGEGRPRSVRSGEGSYATVVRCRGVSPRGHSTTDARIVADVNVGRHASNGRCFVVGHRNGEARRRLVSSSVHSGVGHRSGAHHEGVSAVVG